MYLFSEADFISLANLISTITLAILTAVYVVLTQKQVKAQTDPCVVVYAEHDESRPTIILLIIKNVGTGIAKNVRFKFSEPIVRVYGMSDDSPQVQGPIAPSALVDGLPLLEPGGTRKYIWGQFKGLKAALGDRKVTVTVSCDRIASRLDLDASIEPLECVLDIDTFGHHDAVDSDGARQTAKQLEKLVSLLKDRLPNA